MIRMSMVTGGNSKSSDQGQKALFENLSYPFSLLYVYIGTHSETTSLPDKETMNKTSDFVDDESGGT